MAVDDFASTTVADRSLTERGRRYLRQARWLHTFVVLEILLVGAGLALNAMGTNNEGIGASVSPVKSGAGLLGAFALVLALFLLFGVLIAIVTRIRRRLQVDETFSNTNM
jgi:hypothetical protein